MLGSILESLRVRQDGVDELFLTLMVVGLVGLFMMALPAFKHHGHVHATHAGRGVLARGGSPRSGAGHAGGDRTAVVTDAAGGVSAASAGREIVPSSARLAWLLRFVPSPRALCSVLALYGAFGNALVRAFHMSVGAAVLVAALLALLVERLIVRPVWNLLFHFQGQPSSPLGVLVLSEAQAVVPFRNGRGMVSVVRDGRVVQLAATLREDHAGLPVRVGDRLRIEDVDARRERVVVSIVDRVTFAQKS
ncbi:MAG TPA: hypothetical protein VK762_04155 [Polyangiaceae bacterium]|nr:hypothetical protein [Polyangiaceae bacterium]